VNPEIFYAAGLAADYCSTDEGWENFRNWARTEGILGDIEELSREVMEESLFAIRLIVRQLEIDRFQERLSEALQHES
jgi:hypothetical protein